MTARLLILSPLDPRGGSGLAADVAAAAAFGVDVVPFPTGLVTGEPGERHLIPARARSVERAVVEAFEDRVDGMLIGTLGSYWQARSLARVLQSNLPETLVWAPLGAADCPPAGPHSRKVQLRSFLPETTTVVLPSSEAAGFLGCGDEPADIGRAAIDAGALSLWLRGSTDNGRGLDLLFHGGERSVMDTPRPAEGARPATAPAALAALLALGISLREAVARASRSAAHIGGAVQVAAR